MPNTDYKARAEASAKDLVQMMDSRWERRRYATEATVTSVIRDGAERIRHVLATIDGASSQMVSVDYGAPYRSGETLAVVNDGSPTLPIWRATRKVQSVEAIPYMDPHPSLPTPAGLALTTGHWEPEPGGGMKAWLYVSWQTIPDRFGYVGYEVEWKTNDANEPTPIQVLDLQPSTELSEDITSGGTVIPRDAATSAYDFPRHGRIKIEDEHISYDRVTDGDPDSGVGGVGTLNLFTVSGAGWTADEWINFVLVDSAGTFFLVSDNGTQTLVVSGTPANGAWAIRPCFSGCTRGVGGTTPAAHVTDIGVMRLSAGVMIDSLQPDIDYNVRVRVRRMDGAVSAWTSWSSEQTDIDTTPPPDPTNFTVTNAVNGVHLAWDAQADTVADLKGYYIYQATDGGGTGAAKVHETGPRNKTFVYAYPPGYTYYYNIKAIDTSNNLSGYGEAAWQSGKALWTDNVNLLFNSDFERDDDGDNWPDSWAEGWIIGSGTASWGNYGYLGGKGVRFTMDDDDHHSLSWVPTMNGYYLEVEDPYTDMYTVSCYIKPSAGTVVNIWGSHPQAGEVGVDLIIHYYKIWDPPSGGYYTDVLGYAQTEIRAVRDGWYRISAVSDSIDDPTGYGNNFIYMGVSIYVHNNYGSQITFDIDKFQYERNEYMTDWKPCLGGPKTITPEPAGLMIDAFGVKTFDDTFHLGVDGKMVSHLEPRADSSYDVGTSSAHWRAGYYDGLVVGNTGYSYTNAEVYIVSNAATPRLYLNALSDSYDPTIQFRNNVSAVDWYLIHDTASDSFYIWNESYPIAEFRGYNQSPVVVFWHTQASASNRIIAGFGLAGASAYGSGRVSFYGASTEIGFLEANSITQGPFRWASSYADINIGSAVTSGSNPYGSINFITANDSRMTIWGGTVAGVVGIGDRTISTNMTRGLTIHQAGYDDEILAFKNSDVAHGALSWGDSNVYGSFRKAEPGSGGLQVRGLKSGAGSAGFAMEIQGFLAENADTTKGRSGAGIIDFYATQTSGDSLDDVVGNGNIVSFRVRHAGGQTDTVSILDEDGDWYKDGLTPTATGFGNYDEYDDIALLHGLRAALVPALRERWGHFLEEARDVLEATGVAYYNDDGSVWIGVHKFTMLLADAIRQRAMITDGRLGRLEAENAELRERLNLLLN